MLPAVTMQGPTILQAICERTLLCSCMQFDAYRGRGATTRCLWEWWGKHHAITDLTAFMSQLQAISHDCQPQARKPFTHFLLQALALLLLTAAVWSYQPGGAYLLTNVPANTALVVKTSCSTGTQTAMYTASCADSLSSVHKMALVAYSINSSESGSRRVPT